LWLHSVFGFNHHSIIFVDYHQRPFVCFIFWLGDAMTLYMLEWVEGQYDDVSVTLCGAYSSPEKRQEEKDKLIATRNAAGKAAFDPSYYEGEWREFEIELDDTLVTKTHTDYMGSR
jgi:hypothetical protein